jgi:hypothetical protein
MHRPRLVVCSSVLLLLTCAGPLAAQPPRVRVVDLKAPASTFAFDRLSGALLAVHKDGRAVTVYPRAYLDGTSNRAADPAAATGRPAYAVFKQVRDKGYFVIGGKDANLYVLDTTTGKQIKKIPLSNASAIHWLSASTDPNDPHVYYTFSSKRRYSHDVARVNVATGKDGEAFGLEGTEVVVSAGGRYFYTRRSGVSPSGFRAARLETDESTGRPRMRSAYSDHRSCWSYVPDPFGQYTASDEAMYTVDLARKLADLAYKPLAFFPDRPLIVGHRSCSVESGDQDNSGRELVTASWNTFKVNGRMVVPKRIAEQAIDGKKWSLFRSAGHYGKILNDYGVFADAAGNRILLAFGAKVMVAPLQMLNLPDEPILHVRIAGARDLFVGRPAVLKLVPMDRRVRFELNAKPTGMSLVGNEIRWQPTAGQVGPAAVELRVHHGQSQRRQKLALRVMRRSLRLRFTPGAIAMDPDGKLAVAWTRDRDHPFDRRDGDGPVGRIALIDLQSMKQLVSKAIVNPVVAAAVDAHHVYVATQTADAIEILDLKDLSRKRRVFTNGRVQSLLTFSPSVLFVRTDREVRTFAVPALTLKDLGLGVPVSQEDDPWRRRSGSRGFPRRVPSGWYYAGCIFDRSLKRARMLLDVSGFTALPTEDRREYRRHDPWGERPSSALAPWNRWLQNGQLTTAAGQRIAQIDANVSTFLMDYPAVVSLANRQVEAGQGRYGRLYRRVVELVLRDLLTAAPAAPVVLLNEPLDRDRQYHNLKLLLHGTTAYALVGNRLFAHSFPVEQLKRFGHPFEFAPPMDVMLLHADRPTLLQHKLRGGTAPYQFDLTTVRKGLEVNAKTGEVTVSGPRIIDDALGELLVGFRRGLERMSYRTMTRPAPGGLLADRQGLTAAVRKRFERFIGRQPNGMPILLNVGLAATDKDLQKASLRYQVFLEVPPEKLSAARLKIAQEFQSKMAQRRREEEERRQRYEAERIRREAERKRLEAQRRRAMAAATRPADDQIRALEKRVESLEAKIQLLMEMILKMQGKSD